VEAAKRLFRMTACRLIRHAKNDYFMKTKDEVCAKREEIWAARLRLAPRALRREWMKDAFHLSRRISPLSFYSSRHRTAPHSTAQPCTALHSTVQRAPLYSYICFFLFPPSLFPSSSPSFCNGNVVCVWWIIYPQQVPKKQ